MASKSGVYKIDTVIKYILLFEQLLQAEILNLKKENIPLNLICKINTFEQSMRYAHTVFKICPIVKVIKESYIYIYILEES